MNKRGRPSLLVQNWRYLLRMEQYVIAGAKPNAAAERVARECFKEMKGASRPAQVAWLKKNQRKYGPKLREQLRREQALLNVRSRLAAHEAEMQKIGAPFNERLAAAEVDFRRRNPGVIEQVEKRFAEH